MRGYLRGATVAGQIAEFIRRLGYSSRVHSNLDSHVLHIPLILYAGFHVGMVNTRGLRELGLWDSDDAAPRGAIVHRDPGGVPTGIATEIWTLPPAYTVTEVEAALRAHASELFVAKGITSIQTLPLIAYRLSPSVDRHGGQVTFTGSSPRLNFVFIRSPSFS